MSSLSALKARLDTDMKVNEVLDPTMKLRLEISKLRENNEEQRSMIVELASKVAKLERTMTALIKKLGPKS